MDRSKSRTDLLAAGKKRLQQFRQKKDGKGGSSRGKSKKSDKSIIPESDTDGRSSPSMSTTSSQVTDGNIETDNESNAVSMELFESQSSPNSLTLDNVDPSADSSPLAVTNTTDEQTELDSDRKSAQVQEGREVDSELSSQDQGKGAQDVGADVAEDVSLRTSDDQAELDSERKSAIQVQEVREVNSELSSQYQGKGAQDVGADVAEDVSLQTSDDQTELDSQRKSTIQVQEIQEVNSESSSQDQGNGSQGGGAYVVEDISLQTSENQIDLESDRSGVEAREVSKEDSELSPQDQGKDAQDVRAVVAEDVSLQTTDSLGPEGGPTYDHESAPAIVATAVGEPVPVTREGDNREVSLLLSEDTPITSLMQTKEDKDADGLDMEKSSQNNDVEEPFHETEQLGTSIEVLSSTKDIIPDQHLASDQAEGDDIANGGPSGKDLEGKILSGSSHEEMHLQSTHEQIAEQIHSGHGRGLQEGPCLQRTPVGSVAVDPSHELSMGYVDPNHELSMGDDVVNLARPVDASPSFGARSVDFMKVTEIIKDLNEDVLAEIIRGLNEDEFRFLLKSRGAVSDANPIAASSTLPDSDFSEAFHRLKEELFLSTLMKSISDMQLGEHLELQLQSDNEHPQFIDELSELRASHIEVNEKNQHLIEELSNCRAELQDVSQKCVELQNQFNTAKGEVETLSAKIVELQVSCEVSQEDSLNLATDLSDCRGLISCLQAEKKGMNENHELLTAEKIRLADEKEFHLYESKRLSTELSNLKSSMEVTEAEKEVFDGSLGFVSLKTCLNEMEKVLAKLEQATNEFQFQSVGRSGEQVSSAAVSKLIQAFESKTHEDEPEAAVRDSNEVHSSSESFVIFAKEETGNLRKLISEWKGHVQSADVLFVQFEELKQHCSNLEASNVELTVQCEAAKQLLGDFQEKKCHLEELCEALKQEDIQLKAKNNELYEKLGQFQSKVSALYTEICDVKLSSNEMSSIIGGQLENLQKEFTQRTMVLEQGWNTTTAEIFELVSKLNESVGETSSAVSSDAHDSLHVNHLLAVSVNAATKVIFDLREKLEATSSEHETICSSLKEVNMKCEDLLGRNELAVGVLHEIYNDLRKLVLSDGGSMGVEKIDVQSEELPDLLNYNSYQIILRCIGDILTEKRELESVNNEMKSEMEELKSKCLDLDSVSKLIEDLAGALNIERSQIERNKTPLSCLDSLVSSLLQKTRDAEIQLHMTKEGYGSTETELAELNDKIHYLDVLSFEKENEILVLKESLLQAEEALTAVHSELLERTHDLEHSEQKLSSVREKLSIAVAKGKGLVVQRDGLKQSLSETSYELERCMEELQLKDARLHEVETKLKAYAEAGERMEAMESELSYIRNSSNSLRESFLLKDSMLQRIEEVLEELDLPEQFHSGDIIEKIDWLARSVASNSLPMNEWEQKDSAGGGSYSDAGYVARESWKDDSQPPPDSGDDSQKDDSQPQPDSGDVQQQQEELQASLVPLDGDDLRKKFEELHKKYYGLAEQNEMLEQSLMERNSIVQRWEELVDRIDMPSHLRSMEMEDRIEWVGRALAEANHHVDSLQLKIEKYESYCGLLNSDLEGYQRTVSALQTDLRLLTTEREHLSEKLEALMLECERLSTEAGQAEYQNEVMHSEISSFKDILEKKELENEKLHNELASLKDILEKKDAIEEQVSAIDSKLRKLHDLVGDVLPEYGTENLVSGVANIDSLEELLRKLIEDHTSFRSKKDAIEEQIFTIDGKLRKLHDLVGDVLPKSETENLVSGSANIDSLEELLIKLVENQASLQSKKDEIEEQIFTIDGKLKKLHDLVGDVLAESETENLISGSANIDSLEELLRKLIENHANLQSKKDAIEEQIFTIDGKLRKLHDLVGDVLPESETENIVSGSANIDSLEELLRKLIENQASLQSKKDAIEEQIFTIDGKLRKLHDIVRDVLPEYETVNLVSGSANIDSLEELLRKLIENQANLQLKKDAVEEQISSIDSKLRKLHGLVGDVLPESERENLVSGSANIDSLEELLRKVIGNQANLQSNKPMHAVELDSDHSLKDGATILEARSTDMHDKEEADIDRYKKELEEALSELEHAKEERESTLEKQMSLSIEVEALSKKTEELQLLLNQEEQKSASVREKLNVAVRKGKSLVQHRDSLKQTIEEMSTEIKQLKSEISNRDETLTEHVQKLSHLSTYPNRFEALESEMIHLKNQLAESVHHLQEKEYSLNLILNKLGEIDIGGEGYVSDPIKKLEYIGKLCSDLHGTVASLEQESRKSKRAAELLLAELNEVQERNDAFQEELAKADAELVDLRKERDSADAAKLEALSHLQKLSALHEEGKKSHFSEMTALTSSMNQLCRGFDEIHHLLGSTFSMDLESFQNLESGLKSCMKGSDATNMLDSSVAKTHYGKSPWSSITKSSLSSDFRSDFDTAESFHLLGSQLQEVLVQIGSLKERIAIHSSLMLEQDKNLSELIASIEREIASQRAACESMKQKVTNQDGELVSLRGSIDYLCEACISSLNEIENRKAELVGNKVEFSAPSSFGNGESEERIKTLADRLLMAAKSFANIRTEFSDVNQNEMKATITNLQLELQEKDVQRERICSDLVKQIKDAEASANSYTQDLQSLKIQEHNLKKQLEVIEAERKILEERVNELQEKQRVAAELEEKSRSQTDLLAAKDQEIESLMHALDEEETQMEELTDKIVELEKVVQQKTQEIESLESSRGKVTKKLAVTVSKFDELHHLSASLLSEVERLQFQLQERDSEISFLRQEVTRCTNDVLLASQMSNKTVSDEIFELLMWVDTMISQEGMHDILPDLKSNGQVHEYKEILQKKLMSVLAELENLKADAENKDAMLQEEKSKIEKLNHKAETLEKSLHEKEMQLNLLEGVEENGKEASTSSEILEVEPVVNEWRTGPFVTPQVRSLRKGNNDYVAIAVDEDPGSTSRIEDEEDDKVHGFKSLTSSKIVPRFTRPVTDLIDGLWVSCDRTLMRRPILRLGIIIYWAIVHALLAFFVV